METHFKNRDWLNKILVVGICVSSLVVYAKASSMEPVHHELARLQKQNGLSLFAVTADSLGIVDFNSRSLRKMAGIPNQAPPISPVITVDGAEIAFVDCSPPEAAQPSPTARNCPRWHLATIHVDGTHFRQFPNVISPESMCWSHDKSKIALNVAGGNLDIFDLANGELQQVAGRYSYTTTQCWSIDDKQFIYFDNKLGGVRNVLVYDMEQRKSRLLSKGVVPTWSPDGQWISFLVDDAYYYAIHPNGDGKRLLFKASGADSGLLWSPDSRLVAYASERGRLC